MANKTVADVIKLVKDNEVKFVDFRFTDTRGKEQHVSVPVSHFDEDKFTSGHAFDGSSIAGWKGIEASDMLLIPDPNTANIDPFFEEPTLILSCDVIDPTDGKPYERDPRSLAKRAEAYLKSSGRGDTAYFGPEPEFFVFDSVRWGADLSGSFVKIESEEGAWNSGKEYEHGNSGYRPSVKGGYFPVPPVDSGQDLRSEISLILESLGIPVEVHHHEVANAGQMEIGTKFATLTTRADWLQLQKYVITNVAHAYGKTATFMPKPIVGDNGSGMHVHQSVWKDGKNLFAGEGYAGLSEFALYYIGGIIKHARALNAITNPGTNSYKRLVPGFEAPVKLAYSANQLLKGTGLVPDHDILHRDDILAGRIAERFQGSVWLRDVSEGSTSGKGAIHVHTQDEASAWMVLNKGIEHFMVSEYLPGRNLACLMLFNQGQVVKIGCYERLEYFMAKTVISGVSGNISRGRLINDAKAVNASLAAISQLCHHTGDIMHGLVTVDLRTDAQDQPKVTEINLRQVAAASAFAEVAGANLAEAHALATFGLWQDIGPIEVHFPDNNRLFRDIDGLPVYVGDYVELPIGQCLSAPTAR